MILNYMYEELGNEETKQKKSKEYTLSDFDTSKNDVIEELKSANYHDIEDLNYRMQRTYDEVMDILYIKIFPSRRTGYTLPPGIHEIGDINKTLEYLFSDTVKVSNTIDDIRLRSSLIINQTLIFTRKSFFYTIIGFFQSHSGPLIVIERFIQLIPGPDKSKKPINITGIDKIPLKRNCIGGAILD